MFRLSEQMIKKYIFFASTPLLTPQELLFFSQHRFIFAEQQARTAMKKKESATARLFRFLETERTFSDFPAVCARLHLMPGALNESLLRETGLSGEEIILRQLVE
jgi:hypothetical protein